MHNPSSGSTNGAASGRDRHGRFAKDNPGGPGNPFGRQVAAFRAALIAAVTAEDIQRVMAALLEQAVKGNVGAARLFLAYTVGKPAAPADPDRVDVEEWQLVQQTVARPEEVERTFTSVPVQLASKVANAALPVMADELGEQLAARVKTPVQASRLHNEPAPSTNGPPRSPVGAPPVAAAACGANGKPAPSANGANGREPSPTGSNGQATLVAVAEPTGVAAAPPSAGPSTIGNRGLTPLGSPDLRTLRRLARLSGAGQTLLKPQT
jgi:hypothetical protein